MTLVELQEKLGEQLELLTDKETRHDIWAIRSSSEVKYDEQRKKGIFGAVPGGRQ